MTEIKGLTSRILGAVEAGKTPAFAYDRISHERQSDGISLEYQTEGSQRYANSAGLVIVEHFTVTESARKQGRRVFNHMLSLAMEYKVKDIIFKSVDRMSRNYHDLLRIEDMMRIHGIRIHFYSRYQVLHKDSPYTEMFALNVEMAAARQWSDKISQDVKDSHKFKASRGIAPLAPIGYKYDHDNKRWVFDRKEDVDFLFDSWDSGKYSLAGLATELNMRGIRSKNGQLWHPQMVYTVLHNPFYHGEFIFHGELLPGTQDRYYEKARFEKRLKKPRQSRFTVRKNHFPLSDFVRCGECGNVLFGEHKKRWLYYAHFCNGRRKYIRSEKLMEMIDSYVAGIEYVPGWFDSLARKVREEVKGRADFSVNERDRIMRELSRVDAKIERLLDMRLDESLAPDIYRRKLEQLNGARHALVNDLSLLEEDNTRYLDTVLDYFDELSRMPELYKSMGVEARARFLKLVACSCYISESGAVLDWVDPWAHIVNLSTEVRLFPAMLPSEDLSILIRKCVNEMITWIKSR